MSVAKLIFVDCEANGPSCSTGRMTEFGAVEFESRLTFHGEGNGGEVFTKFKAWLEEVGGGQRLIFVSDNPAFDWQWINDGFHKHLWINPFGHSARRIGDFYAGLCGQWTATGWKKLRITKHDHNPVNDAMGNVEAVERMLKGEREMSSNTTMELWQLDRERNKELA